MATSFMAFNKRCFRGRYKTTHDLLLHVFSGSITSDCILIPMLSCVYDLPWDQIQPDKGTENDGFDRKSQVDRDSWPLPVFTYILLSSCRVQR